MNVYWFCLTCSEHGETNKAAETHTKDTHHGTMTTMHQSVAERRAQRTVGLCDKTPATPPVSTTKADPTPRR